MALALILGTSVVTYIGSRFSPLYDISYISKIGSQIIDGQVPYRDFALSVNPFVFFLFAGFQNVIENYGTALWVMTVLNTVFCIIGTCRVSLYMVRGLDQVGRWRFFHRTIVCLSAGVCSSQIVFPFAFYDTVASTLVVWVLVFLLRLSVHTNSRDAYIVGALLALSFMTKQNVGLSAMIGTLFFIGIPRFSCALRRFYLDSPYPKIGIGIVSVLSPFLIYASLTSSFWAFVDGVFLDASNSKSVFSFSQVERYLYPSVCWLTVLGLLIVAIGSRLVRLQIIIRLYAIGLLVSVGVLFVLDLRDRFSDSTNADIGSGTMWAMAPCFLLAGLLIRKSRGNLSYSSSTCLFLSASLIDFQISQGPEFSSYATLPLMLLCLLSLIFL